MWFRIAKKRNCNCRKTFFYSSWFTPKNLNFEKKMEKFLTGCATEEIWKMLPKIVSKLPKKDYLSSDTQNIVKYSHYFLFPTSSFCNSFNICILFCFVDSHNFILFAKSSYCHFTRNREFSSKKYDVVFFRSKRLICTWISNFVLL